jgi:hypothetical protein
MDHPGAELARNKIDKQTARHKVAPFDARMETSWLEFSRLPAFFGAVASGAVGGGDFVTAYRGT